MTTELCMNEIKNCQRLSMGPNFVVFLGQKYGYRPIPTYILTSELMMIRDELISLNVDASLLEMWYKKDSNAVPPISVLQPISSILVNFNNKVRSVYFRLNNWKIMIQIRQREFLVLPLPLFFDLIACSEASSGRSSCMVGYTGKNAKITSKGSCLITFSYQI